MNILNCTPHCIDFYSEDDCDLSNPRRVIVNQDATPFYSIAPSGRVLNASRTNSPAPVAPDSAEWPFPVEGAVVFTGFDPLPLLEDGSFYDLYIVSNLYRSAYNELAGSLAEPHRLATVNKAVYRSDVPAPVGCLGLAVG